MSSWPRGSEWRIWDLHLHAPGTKLSDCFSVGDGDVWSEYCQRLTESPVAVFGITDYFSADCFLRARSELTARHPTCSKLLVPNIELRFPYVVNRAQEEVHVHLLFNPELPSLEADLQRFLAQLETNKTDRVGRTVKAAELKTTSDYEEATASREAIHTALTHVFGRDADLSQYVLIVCPANNDGIRPERGKKRKELLSDEMDKFSNCFWGHRGNVDYYLGPDRLEDPGVKALKKPVLSATDAHSFTEMEARLGRVEVRNDGTRYEPTWIKADPTFEGLRQILFEPENRVYIGEEPPVTRRVRENKTKYIQALKISSNGRTPIDGGVWFQDIDIPLNHELVAIIGNKGSGKSAVTDVLGLVGNSHHQHVQQEEGGRREELFSFLNSRKFLKGGLASAFEGRATWEDDEEPPPRALDAKVNLDGPERVEYLPQKYLERLCGDLSDEEFRATLNAVIFRYIPRKDRYDQPDLASLIEYRTRQAAEDIEKARDQLADLVSVVVGLEKKLTPQTRRELEERLRLRVEELSAHESERPAEVAAPTEAEADPEASQELEKLREQISRLDDDISTLHEEQTVATRRAEDVRQIRQAIARDAATLLSLKTRFDELFSDQDLSFKDVVNVEVDYSHLDSEVERLTTRLDEISARLSPPATAGITQPGEEAEKTKLLPSLIVARFELVEKQQKITSRLAKPARDYATYLAELKKWTATRDELAGAEESPGNGTKAWLERELSRQKTEYPAALAAARGEVSEKAGEIFALKLQLAQFYDEIKTAIDAEIARCRDELGEYAMSVDVDLHLDDGFNDAFLERINQRAAGTFRGVEDGRDRLHEVLEGVFSWKDETAVFGALEEIVARLHEDKRPDSANEVRSPFDQVASKHSLEELYGFLFGLEYLEPKYDLRVDGKDLSELSPGERGGLLLIFYLMLDRRDIPLVIDQPEDNLDNRSVYEVLVRFIKRAKARRQIVLVTHNPNLAVVADAEQIVHVHLEKTPRKNAFSFSSGSIEAPEINRALVDILEGTLPAFDNRRLKYRPQGGRAEA
ncbi:MAG: hypothetical protein WD942_03845 [Dehalococcoidia bacterium]